MQFRFGAEIITVNVASRADLMAQVMERLNAGKGFALATLNLDHLAKLSVDAGFRAAYVAQDLVVADGNPVVWLARIARRPVELIPGSDLVVPLAQLAAAHGVGIAIVGSTEAALDQAAEQLSKCAPALTITLRIAPPFGIDPSGPMANAILDQVAQSGARLCFLALGAPKQEVMAALGRKRAPHVGFVSVGAGIDFLAGHQLRAPLWMRNLALEWVWRMLFSPRRLIPRYLRCAMVLPAQLQAALDLRRNATE